jgi:intracellular multiplication protein IcmB
MRIEDFITTISRNTVSDAMPDYCDLRTIVNLTDSDRNFYPDMQVPFIAVTEAGHYASTLRYRVAFVKWTRTPLPVRNSVLMDLSIKWPRQCYRPKSPGHKISVVIENDPSLGKSELKRLMAHQFRSIAPPVWHGGYSG